MSQRSGHQPDSRHDACGHRADWSHDPAVRGRAGLPACWIRAQSRLFPCPRNPATNLTPGTMRPGTEQADPMSLRSGDPPESRMRLVTARYKVVPRIYKPECDLYQHSTNLYLCFISQNGFVPARYKFVPLFYKPKWICTGTVQICTSVLQAGKWFVPQPRDDLYIIIKYHGGTNPQFCCLLGSPGAI